MAGNAVDRMVWSSAASTNIVRKTARTRRWLEVRGVMRLLRWDQGWCSVGNGELFVQCKFPKLSFQNMKSADIGLLRALDALLATGSVTQAALRLHLSTPAMS